MRDTQSLIKNRIRAAGKAMSVAMPLLCVTALLPLNPAFADVWVFEPSVALDQRIDDNFRLNTFREEGVASTRAVASARLSRESKRYLFLGQARVDGLLSINEEDSDELTSNQILFFDTQILNPRSRWGLEFTFRRDTPSRDISADITDLSQTAADTGASVTQDQNVDRQRIVVKPSYQYELSRRSKLTFSYSYTDVEHGLPSVQDAIDNRIEQELASDLISDERREALLNIVGPADINDLGRFTVMGELDDFTENLIEVNFNHKLSRRDTLSTLLSFSAFEAQSELTTAEEPDRLPDPRQENILRNPRFATTVDTIRATFGYERLLSPTFTAGIQVGYFTADADTFGERVTNDGYTAVLTAVKQGLRDRFSGRFGVDVFPSDVGDVVESLELVADYQRQLSQLTIFNFRLRAFEPDAISDTSDADAFARRFLSIEPKIIWNFRRAWSAAASYRYRRQKSQTDPQSGDSNALLFSIKYTQPSAIADARREGGLITRESSEP